MQLHACLLLFIIITTDETLASSDHPCGGKISLDQSPSGSISLSPPGPDRTDRNLSLCVWLVDVPPGRDVALKLDQLDGGSRITVRCDGAEGGQNRVLETGREALLSGCEGNQATLTWTGAGRSSAQLQYHVQEDERHSSEGPATAHQPGRALATWTETGTSFTRTSPASRGVGRGTEDGRGRLYESSEGSHGPRAVSGPTTEDQGPPRPTTALEGLTAAAGADRETLPLPEEGANNGADASGTVPLADGPVSATEGTHAYFHSRHTPGADTSSVELAAAQMARTDAAASSSDTMTAAEKHEHTDAAVLRDARARPSGSSVSVPPLSSSQPQTAWGGAALAVTYIGEEDPITFSSGLTSAVTSDPVTPPTKPPQDDSSRAHAEADSSASRGPSGARASSAHITELHTSAGTVTAASLHPNAGGADSRGSTTSHGASQTDAVETFDSTTELRAPTSPPSLQSLTRSAHTSAAFAESSTDIHTATQRYLIDAFVPTIPFSSSSPVAADDGDASGFTGSSSTSGAALTSGDVSRPSSVPAAGPRTHTPVTSTHPQTSLPAFQPSTSMYSSDTLQTHTPHPPLTLSSSTPVLDGHTPIETSTPASTSSHTQNLQSPSSSAPNRTDTYNTTEPVPPPSPTTATLDLEVNRKQELEKDDESWRVLRTSTSKNTSRTGTSTNTSRTGPPPSSPSTPHPSISTITSSSLTSSSPWSSTSSHPPKYYIVPDQPAAIKVETIELLLQIILDDSGSADAAGLEEDAAAWVRPYLQNAPGFSRLLGAWTSGHAVQNLVEFRTSGALQWLGATGSTSLLERTGLAQAARDARSIRLSRIANITLGGQQGQVCDWLLRCPAGYKCVSQPGNYSCSSLCHDDYCHHHGICTHHPGQLPVCRCLVGDDFWYMGQRCDVRMTRARLIGACLAVLLIVVMVIGVLAVVAVRRYRAILIQAKVDQTRSSYRRFNHFDELSGRFWLRSWAGSADSLDNPAFTRSDELLHLRALDRPCCYHDDTLSLASTCPSHGARINTIYPHSSQYAWRGSEMSVGDGVLDSGKASDLSVCSWPVEPIQWTPFPLLQQLASHRTPMNQVRVSRPRSYCEGMELVDLEKSWTA